MRSVNKTMEGERLAAPAAGDCGGGGGRWKRGAAAQRVRARRTALAIESLVMSTPSGDSATPAGLLAGPAEAQKAAGALPAHSRDGWRFPTSLSGR